MSNRTTPRARKEPAIPLAERTYYCAICDGPFTPAKHNQKTCCDDHAHELELKHVRERAAVKRMKKNGGDLLRPCIICQTPFKPRNDDHVCCSDPCRTVRRSNLQKGKREERRVLWLSEGNGLSNLSTEEVISEVHRRGFFATKQPQTTSERFAVDLSMFEGEKIMFALVSDTHLCSRQQQISHLASFYRLCSDVGIDTVFHAGDIVEGNGKVYPGQLYDLFLHGADEQADYAAEVYPRETGITTYFITGNHDDSWFKSGGHDIGKRISEKRDDMKYLGVYDAYVDLAPNVDINLHHPDGGTAYALSYNAQKKVEAYPPELKPKLASIGHYHRNFYMGAYRNVDAFLTPCFQSQTNFLKRKKIYPVVGAWIVEAWVNEDGLARVRAELVRFYVPVENDY